jgi:hypothetical protein
MRVLVACEFSGVVRDAFAARGHDAWSCDLLPTESPGNHYQGDVRIYLQATADQWDLLIAHPPCTYLSNSGVRHLHSIPSRNGVVAKVHGAARWQAMREGAEFFRDLLNAPIPRIAVENPIPHRYAVAEIGRKYDQIIQPWQYGHGEVKKTCLWLSNLPPLEPTDIVEGRYPRSHLMGPSKNRAKKRSVTYTGIAAAMADQWGSL